MQRFLTTPAAVLALIICVGSTNQLLAAAFKWTGAAGDHNWSTRTNWSPAGVPGAADSVTIPLGSLITNAGSASSISNAGSVDVTASLGNFSSVTNSGVLEAVGSGAISLNGPVNNASGTIQAVGASATVFLPTGGAPINGGTLNTPNGGTMLAQFSAVSGVSNLGKLQFQGSVGLQLQGQIANQGILVPSQASVYETCSVGVANGQSATLSGGGQIQLTSGLAVVNPRDSFGNLPGVLVNQDNSIHGYGTIYGNVINNAVISADTQTRTLTMAPDAASLANHGTFAAQNGGTLMIQNTIDNTTGSIVADGSNSQVLLYGGTITGGSLNNINGGAIYGNGSTLSGVNNLGTLTIQPAASSPHLAIQGQISNKGLITCSNGNIGVPVGQSAILTGGGQILLNNTSASLSSNNVNGTLTNQDNLIHGYGTIYANIINAGIVSADSAGNTLIITSFHDSFTNSGTLKAEHGGTLSIQMGLENTGGSIVADGAQSQVILSNNSITGPITGGTLNTINGGVITTKYATIANITNIGTLRAGSITDASYLSVQGQITNRGTILAVASGLSATARQTAALTGGGEVALSGFINGGTSGVLTNQDNVIHGLGYIEGNFVNNAIVSADNAQFPINLDTYSGPITNNGTLKAEKGGTLIIRGALTGTGTFLATGGSISVQNNCVESSADVRGGALELTAGQFNVPQIMGTFKQSGGTFSPAAIPASGTISGDYNQLGGSLTVSIGGASAGQYTTVDVGGTATLNGKLQLQTTNGFYLGQNQRFPVMSVTGSITGDFGYPEGGLVGNLSGTNVYISFSGNNGHEIDLFTVPEPCSLSLGMLGLAGLKTTLRRRKYHHRVL